MRLKNDPVPYVVAEPNPSNILEWYAVSRQAVWPTRPIRHFLFTLPDVIVVYRTRFNATSVDLTTDVTDPPLCFRILSIQSIHGL